VGDGLEEPRELWPWEVRALKTAHRRVPLGEVDKGHCRWCERSILGTRGRYIGRPDPNRSWCRPTDDGGRDCWYDFCLHSRLEPQFNYLSIRHGLKCAVCGVENPQRWRKAGEGTIWESLPPTPWEGERTGIVYWQSVQAHREAMLAEFPMWGSYSAVMLVPDLEVDHVIPLWKVALMGLSAIELRPFFGPDNLQLACSRCHKAKTKAEAGERARERAAQRDQFKLL
jgi:5-methylcytosine-specific restriction endonuclease McrA